MSLCSCGCSNLVEGPLELPAKFLDKGAGCYGRMFADCVRLQYAPKIKAIDFSTGFDNDSQIPLWNMFINCLSLKKIEVDFSKWPTNRFNHFTYKYPLQGWLNNISPSGTFYCPYGLDTSIRDVSHIPVGWDVVYTSVPESVVNQAAAVENLIMNND